MEDLRQRIQLGLLVSLGVLVSLSASAALTIDPTRSSLSQAVGCAEVSDCTPSSPSIVYNLSTPIPLDGYIYIDQYHQLEFGINLQGEAKLDAVDGSDGGVTSVVFSNPPSAIAGGEDYDPYMFFSWTTGFDQVGSTYHFNTPSYSWYKANVSLIGDGSTTFFWPRWPQGRTFLTTGSCSGDPEVAMECRLVVNFEPLVVNGRHDYFQQTLDIVTTGFVPEPTSATLIALGLVVFSFKPRRLIR